MKNCDGARHGKTRFARIAWIEESRVSDPFVIRLVGVAKNNHVWVIPREPALDGRGRATNVHDVVDQKPESLQLDEFGFFET
jgi:hypothetical protein